MNEANDALIVEGLRGKRVIVTGGTGFIGGRLVERLVSEYGVRPVVLVRSTSRDGALKRMGAAIEVVNAAITDRTAVSAALKGCNVIFHCAYDPVDGEANLQGARNLIEPTLRNGARLVHVSTFAIYEPFLDQRLTEDTPVTRGDFHNSLSRYADNKMAIDTEIVEAVRLRGLNAVILLPTIVYGANGLWTRIPVQLLLTGTVILPGTGDGLCNAVHVDDVCQALLLAAVVPAAQGHRYFVSAFSPVTWRTFFESYAQILGCRGPAPSQIPVLSEPETRNVRVEVAQSVLTRRVAKWVIARLGGARALSRARRLYHRRAPPVIHTLDAVIYGTKCHVVIDKIVRELGYTATYDLERGMMATAPWIKDSFRDEIEAVRYRQP
jgi:nucleoside-diphosphate-sugar epimerase